MKYQELGQRCVGGVTLENVMEHMLWLTRETPYRIAGGGQDRKAAEYVQRTMASYGLDAEITEFETYNSYPGQGALKVVSPVERAVECLACLHIEATPPEGREAELVYVAAGGEADYLGKDVRGKFVLAEVSYSPATPEKARLAYAHGAAGLVLMNWGSPDQNYIPMRALKAVWGNPTPETWQEIPLIHAVTTTRADGECLKQLCLAGPVTIRMTTTSDRRWGVVPQPVATLKAPESSPEAEQFIIVSGHLDAWEPGVTDNATGNAIMLEVARVLAQHREYLRRSVVFCFWNGHEIAEAAGSSYFVDSRWDAISEHGVAYLNIDSPGMKQATYFLANSSPELALFHGPVEEQILGQRGVRQPLSRTGDQSFLGVGVPSLTGRFSHRAELVREWNGATLGWWNHTTQEDLEKVDPNLLYQETRLWMGYILSLATAPVLPHRFTPRADDIAAKLKRLADGADPVGLAALVTLSERLAERCRRLDAHAERLAAHWGAEGKPSEKQTQHLNRTLLRMSRHLTSASATVGGKYAQDSYGLSTLAAPVPMLAIVERVRALPADSLECRLLTTKLRRARNQVSDALRAALDEIDSLEFRLAVR